MMPTTTLKNDRFLRALRREPVDCTPIWLMRQAGRYLPEYRALRAKAGSFLTLAKTPELACEVTLQPLERFAFDAAILFSDILTVPDAMGLGLQFADGEGPFFTRPISNAQDIQNLHLPEPEVDLRYVMDAVRLIRQSLDNKVPLIGFSGSPWTLACYMIEGKGSERFINTKKMLLNTPHLMHQLLQKNADAVYDYLASQIAAGVQAVMIFDTWGGILSPHHYREFSLRYMTEIVQRLNAGNTTTNTPIILFSKGVSQLELIADSGCTALGLDWMQDLKQARERVGDRVALQGNLDPTTLLAEPEAIYQAVQHTLDQFGNHAGHIFNLGHGITPDVPPEHVQALVEAVHTMKPSVK